MICGREVLYRNDLFRCSYGDPAFPDFKNLMLIKVVPEKMDILNYSRGALGDATTWHPPAVDFKKQ